MDVQNPKGKSEKIRKVVSGGGDEDNVHRCTWRGKFNTENNETDDREPFRVVWRKVAALSTPSADFVYSVCLDIESKKECRREQKSSGEVGEMCKAD